MNAEADGIKKLHRHAIHMCHRQDAQHVAVGRHVFVAEILDDEVDVAHDGPVGDHDTFGESRGAAGVVDDSQLVRTVMVILHMLRAEFLGKFPSEKFVEVLSGEGELVGARHEDREVGQVDDAAVSSSRRRWSWPPHRPQTEIAPRCGSRCCVSALR